MKKDWEIKKLGEVCTYFKQQGKYDDLPYVGMEDIESKTGIYLGSENISSVQSSTFFFEKNDVLFGRLRPYLAKVYLAEFSGHCSTEIFPIRVKKDLLASYLKLWLLSDKTINSINETCTGARMPRADMNEVLSFEILVPPLEEQKRIVKILDEKFAQLETIKANAQTNLQNAKDLFQSQLTKAFSNTTWEKKRLDEITTIINGYAFPSKDFSKTNTVKSIKITNVGVGTFIEDDDEKLPSDYLFTKTEVMVYSKDLVIALTRTIISDGLKIAFVPESFNNALVNQRVAAMRPNETQVLANLLYYFFKTDIAYNYVLEHVNTLMQPNLSIGDLKSFPIPLPPLPEQKRIVKELDSLSEKVRQLQEIYTKQIANCDELKQSLLQKAFEGEL